MSGVEVSNLRGEDVMAAALDGVAVVHEGQFVDCNVEFPRIYGFESIDDVVGRAIWDPLPPATAIQVREEILPSLGAGEEWRGSLATTSRDADVVPRKAVFRRIDEETVLHVVQSSAKQHREHLLEAALDATDDAICLLDGTDTIWHATSEMQTVTGAESSDLVGKHVDAVLPSDALPEDADDATTPVDVEVPRDGDSSTTYSVRLETIEHDGETGRYLRFSEAAAKRDSVAAVRDRYQKLIETSPAPIGIVAADFEILECNDAGVEFFGGDDPGDVVGENAENFIHEEDLELVRTAFEDVLDGASIKEPVEERFRALDDEKKFATATKTPITYEGEPAVQVVLNDITQFKRTQEMLDQRRRLNENIMDAVDDILFVIDEEGEMAIWNEMICKRLGYTEEEINGMDAFELIAPEYRHALPDDKSEIVDMPDTNHDLGVLTKNGDVIMHEFRGTTFEDEKAGRRYRCGVARDISERLERERELERQRDELETLNNINELLVDITRALVETPTREAVEETVCKKLIRSELYDLAWIGDAVDGEDYQVRTQAGEAAMSIQELGAVLSQDESLPCPTNKTEWERESSKAKDVSKTDRTTSYVTEIEATDDTSVTTVPLLHGDTMYGVLSVCADRSNAFTEREQAGFEILGETIGFVINAIESRQLLVADSVTELEFEVTGGCFLYDVATELDCDLWLRGYVTNSTDLWTAYIDIDCTSVDDFRSFVEDTPNFVELRVVSESDDVTSLQLTLTEPAFPDVMVGAGSKVQWGCVEDGQARLVLEAPQSADVRDIVERVKNAYESADLVAQRKRDRPVQTATDMRDTLEDRLTERQYTALKTAYLAGYYNWPSRDSTAEDVAADLGVSSPTLHGHLRKANRNLLDVFFPFENPEQD